MFKHLVVLTTPGSFHSWIASALQNMLVRSGLLKEHRLGASEASSPSFVLASSGMYGSFEVTLVTSVAPNLLEELRTGLAYCVIVDEPLPSAAAALEAEGVCSLHQATRAATHAKALYWDLLRSERAHTHTPHYYALRKRADALHWLETLASTLDARVAAVATSPTGPCRAALVSIKRDLKETLGCAPLPSSHLVRGSMLWGEGLSIELHPSFCVLGDNPTTSVGEFVDVTGPARILTGGPYVFLPRGVVRAHLAFEVSAELDQEPFRLSVYSGSTELRSSDFVVDALSPMCLRFLFENPCPHSPVDVHLLSLKGQIDGRLALRSIGFTERTQSEA